jgi:hypothetical protein
MRKLSENRRGFKSRTCVNLSSKAKTVLPVYLACNGKDNSEKSEGPRKPVDEGSPLLGHHRESGSIPLAFLETSEHQRYVRVG